MATADIQDIFGKEHLERIMRALQRIRSESGYGEIVIDIREGQVFRIRDSAESQYPIEKKGERY
ncbi:MAG: DUF2292 domain-containing protein [Anaerolineaceae bacterium]|jgi:hypothetical protein|nr:MAG: DUF2292 domain-containing protein [Anaerolineaceae bacterium]